MNPTELIELMHAALDGEATAAQKRALERQLASDPAACAEFDALQRIFRGLEALPPAHPPRAWSVPSWPSSRRTNFPGRRVYLARRATYLPTPTRSAGQPGRGPFQGVKA
jgi:anti-sigma factor RsiW